MFELFVVPYCYSEDKRLMPDVGNYLETFLLFLQHYMAIWFWPCFHDLLVPGSMGACSGKIPVPL